MGNQIPLFFSFNTQPPEGGWDRFVHTLATKACFNTQPPEGGWQTPDRANADNIGFNTQPPEGGWSSSRTFFRRSRSFNTQPPEGGWSPFIRNRAVFLRVSTHSRLKAAGLLQSV